MWTANRYIYSDVMLNYTILIGSVFMNVFLKCKVQHGDEYRMNNSSDMFVRWEVDLVTFSWSIAMCVFGAYKIIALFSCSLLFHSTVVEQLKFYFFV